MGARSCGSNLSSIRSFHFLNLINIRRILLFLIATTCITCWYWSIFFRYLDRKSVRIGKNPGHSGMNHCYSGINPCHSRMNETCPKCIYEAQPSMLTDIDHGSVRLGNQMFIYAISFAISKYNHRQAFMSPVLSNFISKYFNVSMNTLNQSLYNNIRWTKRIYGGDVEGTLRNISKTYYPHLALTGTAQSWKYFDKFHSQILNEFRFYDHIVNRTKLLLQDIRNKFYVPQQRQWFMEPSPPIMIGVHVRRGDYIQHSTRLNFHLPNPKFYQEAMKYFQNKYGNRSDQQVIFVVASEDNEWCKQNLLVMKNLQIHILEGTSKDMPGLDLAVLSSCDHVIFGLGTFGFWAGYLSPGEVIYCSTCITPNSWLLLKDVYNGDYGNFVPPRWTGFSKDGNKTDRSALAKTSNVNVT